MGCQINTGDMIYSDFSTNMLLNPLSGDVGLLVDENAIRASLRSLILTNKYERVLEPNIGCNITSSMFENMDGALIKSIQESIRETVTNWEPRVNLLAVQVVPYEDQNGMVVTITYSVAQFPQHQLLSVPIVRSR